MSEICCTFALNKLTMKKKQWFTQYEEKMEDIRIKEEAKPKKKRKKYTIAEVIAVLKDHNSYFKKSNKFLMHKFNCGERTINAALSQLQEEKALYNKKNK